MKTMKTLTSKWIALVAMISLLTFSAQKSSAQFFCGAGFQFSINGNTVQFWDSSYSTSGTHSCQWSFGNGTGSTDPNPTVTYSSGGVYSVCLTITDSMNGCSDTYCDSIYINGGGGGCSAYFTSSVNGNTVDFTDASSAGTNSWAWDFGDGNVATGLNPSHTYSFGGWYNVCLSTTDTSGCTSSYCGFVFIAGPGACDATFTSVNNGGNSVTFSNNSGAFVNYYWQFGDGYTSTLPNPTHTYAASGGYYACLTVTDSGAGCSDFYCDSVYVNGGAGGCNASFTFTVAGNNVAFSNTSTGTFNTVLWSFGDGTSSSAMNPTHFYANGTYTVCLTISDSNGTCSDTYCMSMTIGNVFGPCVIGGNVSGYNVPMDYATVYLIQFDTATQILSLVDSFDMTPADSGYFYFTNVVGGTYLVKAAATSASANYSGLIPTYYGNSLFWSFATDVNVCPSNYLVNIQLIAGANPGGAGFVGGSVSMGANKIEAVGDPLAGVEIILLDMSDIAVAYTYSDANGNFSFSNIAYGTYKVYAEMINKITYPAIVTIDAQNPSISNVPVIVNTHEIISGTSVPVITNNFSAVLFPNPANQNATLKMNVNTAGNYQVQITDVAGRILSNTTSSLQQGESRIALSLSDYADGVYMVHVTGDGNNFNLKLTVAK